MNSRRALVVSESGSALDALVTGLTNDGLLVGIVPVGGPTTVGDGVPDAEAPDVVLLGASMGAERAIALTARLSKRFGPAVVFVAFPDVDLTDLTGLAAAGFDYLIPPFGPDVLTARLSTAITNGQVRAEVSEIAEAAELMKYERELQIGREIQAGFLPDSLPQPQGWELEVRFRPAREVAGDFYDGFEMVNGRRVGFVIADVCDKGVASALFMALIRSLLRHTASNVGSLNVAGLDVKWADDDPALEEGGAARSSVTTAGVAPLLAAVAGTSAYMTENHLKQGYFATMFFGVLDPATGSLIYINCGHNPPMIRRANGSLVLMQPTGPALGMLAGSEFRIGRAHLNLGDMLYLYTDGVTEAKSATGRFFGEDRLNEIVTAASGSAGDLLGQVDSALNEFVGTADQFDDITMLALHRRSDPASAHVAGSAPVHTTAAAGQP